MTVTHREDLPGRQVKLTISIDTEGVDSMVFDEIDTGVSGRMAQVVGEKMKHISRGRQVLCVTHLQQIAALADCHFLVEKVFDGQRTSTKLTILDGEKRVTLFFTDFTAAP